MNEWDDWYGGFDCSWRGVFLWWPTRVEGETLWLRFVQRRLSPMARYTGELYEYRRIPATVGDSVPKES